MHTQYGYRRPDVNLDFWCVTKNSATRIIKLHPEYILIAREVSDTRVVSIR